ncbi:S-adenosyl-l-methionine hydroxide adenosyltransferase family protein [Bacteroidota bacterium]
MQLVTLITDWNKDDFYTGAVKGMLLSSDENVKVVTLTNQISPYNISEAAFVLRNCYTHYPPGTIHMIAVASDTVQDNQYLAARINGQILLCADNGIMGLLGDAVPEEIYHIRTENEDVAASFPVLSILCKAARDLIKGKNLTDLGESAKDYHKQIPLRATIENNTITGSVIYLDSFGNAITNITRELFDRIGKSRKYEIFVQSKHYRITKLNETYSESGPGDLLALFNSVGLLEIAIRSGSTAELLNLNTDSTVRIEFK